MVFRSSWVTVISTDFIVTRRTNHHASTGPDRRPHRRPDGDPEGGPQLRRDARSCPVATELEHADEYPTEIVEGLKELGLFGLMIPEEYGGLGESLLTYALAVEEIARGWMSVSRDHQHPLHRRLHAAPARHRGAEAEVPARGWRPARCAARSRCPSPAAAPTSSAITTKAARTDDGGYYDHRPEDVADQRWLGQPGRGAREDRRGAPSSVYRNMTTLPGREGSGLRRDRAGRHHPRQDREDGLQGRRHHRDDLRGPPDPGRPDPRRRARARASTR